MVWIKITKSIVIDENDPRTNVSLQQIFLAVGSACITKASRENQPIGHFQNKHFNTFDLVRHTSHTIYCVFSIFNTIMNHRRKSNKHFKEARLFLRFHSPIKNYKNLFFPLESYQLLGNLRLPYGYSICTNVMKLIHFHVTSLSTIVITIWLNNA